MTRSKKNIDLAEFLIEADPEVCKSVLKTANSNFIKFVGEVAVNILLENIKVTDHFLNKLRHYSKVIRDLGSKRIKHKRRQKLCVENHRVVQLMLKASISHLKD